MRVALVIASFLAACDSRPSEPVQARPEPDAGVVSRTQTLRIEGVSVEVPGHFVALEPEAVAELTAAGKAQEPNAIFELAGLRAPSKELDGTVYVQRSHTSQRPRAREATVRQLLDDEVQILRMMIGGPPLELVDFTVEASDDKLEACGVSRIVASQATVVTRICTVFYIAADGSPTALGAACASHAGVTETLCKPIVASRKIVPGDRLPLDRVLPPSAP